MQWAEGRPGLEMRQVCEGGCALGGADEQDVVLEDGSTLECVNRFYYLGDMLGAARGLWRGV